jgi:hypothetical protein
MCSCCRRDGCVVVNIWKPRQCDATPRVAILATCRLRRTPLAHCMQLLSVACTVLCESVCDNDFTQRRTGLSDCARVPWRTVHNGNEEPMFIVPEQLRPSSEPISTIGKLCVKRDPWQLYRVLYWLQNGRNVQTECSTEKCSHQTV